LKNDYGLYMEEAKKSRSQEEGSGKREFRRKKAEWAGESRIQG
jgi:hypothetical protein